MYERKASIDAEMTSPAPTRGVQAGERLGSWDIAHVIWRRKGGVAACTLLGAAVALAFSLLAEPRYTASTKLIVDPTDLRVMSGSLQNNSGSVSDAQIAQVENEVRVITSNRVLGAVVDSEKLDEDKEFEGGGPSTLSRLASKIGRGAPASIDPKLKALRELAKDVAVKREERTYVIEILVTTFDPAKSARLADAIVSAFIQANADQRSETARRVAGSLKDRLSDLKQGVEAAEQRVEDYKRANNLVAAVGQNVSEQQLADANARLSDSRRQVEQARSRYTQVGQAARAGDPGAMPEALQSLTVANLRSQLAQIMRKEGDVAATLGPRHPDLFEIRSEERNVRGLLKEELARIASTARSDLDRALADQTAAQKAFDALKSVVTTNSQSSVRLRELMRDVDANRAVYEAFLVRTREISEQERVDAANVSVIATAQVLEAKAWPPRPVLVLTAGVFLGLLCGIGLAFLRDFWPVPVRRGPAPPRPAPPKSPPTPAEIDAADEAAWNARLRKRT